MADNKNQSQTSVTDWQEEDYSYNLLLSSQQTKDLKMISKAKGGVEVVVEDTTKEEEKLGAVRGLAEITKNVKEDSDSVIFNRVILKKARGVERYD